MLVGKRIFYIEDDANNRSVVQMILQSQGAEMGFDRWGFVEVTLPRLKVFRPHLILLDLMFPANVTGYDIYSVLRRRTEFANVPVVAISSSDPAIEIPKARLAGFAGFISKPVEMHLLPMQIKAVLNGEEVWNADSYIS